MINFDDKDDINQLKSLTFGQLDGIYHFNPLIIQP